MSRSEHELAEAILDVFNKTAGTSLALSPPSNGNLRMLVSRARDYPHLGADDHQAIIEATFAGPHWWDPPSRLGIIYSPKQFESALGRRSLSCAANNDWDAAGIQARARAAIEEDAARS